MGVVRLLGAFWSPLPCTLTRNDSFFFVNSKKKQKPIPFFLSFLSFFFSFSNSHSSVFFLLFLFSQLVLTYRSKLMLLRQNRAFRKRSSRRWVSLSSFLPPSCSAVEVVVVVVVVCTIPLPGSIRSDLRRSSFSAYASSLRIRFSILVFNMSTSVLMARYPPTEGTSMVSFVHAPCLFRTTSAPADIFRGARNSCWVVPVDVVVVVVVVVVSEVSSLPGIRFSLESGSQLPPSPPLPLLLPPYTRGSPPRSPSLSCSLVFFRCCLGDPPRGLERYSVLEGAPKPDK